MITWAVTNHKTDHTGGKKIVICTARDREEAKRMAQPDLRTNADEYIVEPLSADKDTVVFKIEVKGETDATTHRRHGW